MKNWIWNLFGIETIEKRISMIDTILGYENHSFSQDKIWTWKE